MAIDMNSRSKVRNLCDWNISWERYSMDGDEFIKANQTVYIPNMEIETQVQNNNPFFSGSGNGDHARCYIENSEMREHLGFDNKEEKRTQLILTDDKCKEIFEYKTFATFKKHVTENIITNQEKSKIVNYAKKNKINNYDQIQYLIEFTGLSFKTDKNDDKE